MTPSGGTWNRVSPAPSGPSPVPDLSAADASQLTRLWPRSPGGGGGSPWGPEDLGPLLRHQLASPVPAASGPRAALILREAFFSELPAVEVLPLLRSVKDWSKPQMSRDDGEVPRQVAGVIYFGAILLARIRFGERISDLDDKRLFAAAQWATGLKWLDPELMGFFRNAETWMAVTGGSERPSH